MSASKPRPIHTLSRDLRNTPDEAEPSYSYEDNAFLGGLEDDVEDEFHRRLASTSKRDTSGGGGGGGISAPVSVTGNLVGTGGPASGGAGGSFWRTDMLVGTLPVMPVTVKERKSSGGLLGAALQLHSQASNVSDAGSSSTPGASNSKGGKDKNYSKNNSTIGEYAVPMVRFHKGRLPSIITFCRCLIFWIFVRCCSSSFIFAVFGLCLSSAAQKYKWCKRQCPRFTKSRLECQPKFDRKWWTKQSFKYRARCQKEYFEAEGRGSTFKVGQSSQ